MKINPETLNRARCLAKDHGTISIPYLQMHMKLSYKEAKAVIDKLAEMEDA